jgi:N-carbamoyl-L-amino-acid hydrolase
LGRRRPAVTRLTLSDEDRQARDLLRQWAQEAGFPCAVDSMGNMFIRRAGKIRSWLRY